MLTYAVGDVHGCLDLLQDILGRIDVDTAGRPYRLVLIGDYIDRGPDSAGVVRLLRRLQSERSADLVICLKGNHEDLLLRAVHKPEMLGNWLMNGGVATLESYGTDAIAGIPAEDLAWIAALPVAFEDERRCYVHAGLRPGRDRSAQSDHDRLWIREDFLAGDHDFGKYVVHGHTPRQDGRPEIRRHRVNIDTAAVYGGRLTAALFRDGQAGPEGFLQSPR
jgi:serine/threonine protein phosphatase 1